MRGTSVRARDVHEDVRLLQGRWFEPGTAEAVVGAAIGCLASQPFHGMQTGTTNWATFAETACDFRITPGILVAASLIAIAMGFIGGLLPAVRGSRMKVVDALRRT